jgi:DNA-binding CsgD family transcriptional regulator
MPQFFSKNKLPLFYGIALAAIVFLMKWLEYKYVIIDHALEIYIGAIALIFTALGIWLTLKLNKPKLQTIVVEKEVYLQKPDTDFVPDENQLIKMGISKRESEVLSLMSQGLSNQEIANQLYLSLNTVKTHGSNLFLKLDVKRRTQAIEKGKRMGLIG